MTSERRNDLDWLRLLAIVILLFFHTGMWFNTWGWHVKNAETSESFNYWMVWLHQWRMPLLLFISGAGTWLALGKRMIRAYARERFRRLVIPLVFGMFVVVPPQIYYEHIADYDSYWDFYKTVFAFVPYPKGSLSWHHLWFILYLFLYSMILIPFLRFLKSEKSAAWRERMQARLIRPAGMLGWPAAFIFITQMILRPIFPDETHDLTDVAFFVYYGSYFLFGIVAYASPSVWTSMETNRRAFLWTSALTLIPFYTFYFHFRGIVHLPLNDETVDILFGITASFLGWFTVATAIAWGQHLLRGTHPWLQRINEGLYPFYILHQTVIIVIGYYICRYDWSINLKFWAIAVLTALTCVILIEWIIRPVPFLRLMFGMKERPPR